MSKRPSFQFYPGDWTQNSNLRRCSHELKGIWIDVLCVMHDQDIYGIAFWPLKDIAEAAGTTVPKLKMLVERGILKGADKGQSCAPFYFTPTGAGRKKKDPVLLIAEQAGPIWYSSRMVVDEYKRLVRADNGNDSDDAPNLALMYPIGATPKHAPITPPDPTPSRAGASSSSSPSVNPLSEQTAAAANTAVGENAVSPPPALCLPAEDPTPQGFAEYLNRLEASRGKQSKFLRTSEHLADWVVKGLTFAGLRDAHSLAVMARERDNDPAPLNPGFLSLFVAEVLSQPRLQSVIPDAKAKFYAELRTRYAGQTLVHPDGREFEISRDGHVAYVSRNGQAIGSIAGAVMFKFWDDVEAGVLVLRQDRAA